MNLSSAFKLCSDVRFRFVQDETVVVRQAAREVVVLNEIGGRILELINGTNSVERIIDQLIQEYDVGRAQLQDDVFEFLHEMLESGVTEKAGD